MEQSTIAIIILVITVISYLADKVSITITTIAAMLAMAFTGVLTFEEAFSGFGNTVTIMVAGMLIVSEAFFETGLSDRIGQLISRYLNGSEKTTVTILFTAIGVLSIFFNSLPLLAIFIPIMDGLASNTNGKVTRKNMYLPLAIGGVLGSNISIIGSSSMLNAVGLLAESPYSNGETISFFEPALLGAPGFIIAIIVFMTCGCPLMHKWFDFKEIPPVAIDLPKHKEFDKKMKSKQIITAVVFLACIVGFLTNATNMGAISLVGVVILVVTKCLDEKRAYRNVSWQTIIVVGGSLGFAKGVSQSGAADIIANKIIELFGSFGQSPFVMCVVLLFIGTLLSNFMSNNAAVVILTPISLVMSNQLAADPVAFVLSVAIGVNISLATPICVATITMTAGIGYRFKDYLRFGGFLNIAAFIVTVITLKIVYFL